MIDFVFDKGAANANPSVVLWIAKPTIKNVPSAKLPRPTAAPIAKPSPKLCNPIPIAIMSEIETGVEILENFVLLIRCELAKYNPKNVRIVTIPINNVPLKESARLFCEISNASSNESSAKKGEDL